MIFTFVLGLVIFAISVLLSFLILAGSIFKNVGATKFGAFSVIFFLVFPIFCIAMELAMYYYAPYVWGISYIFIAFNIYFIVMQYFFLVGSAAFTKNNIYRLTKFLTLKKHPYNDVIGYVMKKSSGTVVSPFGKAKVVTYDIEIYFSNNQYAQFSTRDENDKKVSYIRGLLEEHNCHKNGRIKQKLKNNHRLNISR